MKKITDFIRELSAKALEKNAGNALRYRLIYFTGAFIHSIFIILFVHMKINFLIVVNIFSVILYVIGSLFIRNNRCSKVWIILFYVEIMFHAAMCNFILDWSYGFSLYSLMVIPIFYYIAYMDPNIKNSLRLSAVMSVINIVMLVLSEIISDGEEVIPDLPDIYSRCILTGNFVICAIIITLFSSIYIHEMSNAVKDLQVKNDELNFLANYDALTKLRNRHHISDVFHIYEKGTAPFCVILGDIDDFKRINDTYSHDCGDKVLVCVAELINNNISDKGVVCRWGGEEILIILSGKSEECLDLMEKIRLMIQNQRLSFNRKEIKVTMTFGFADYSEAMGIEKLVSIADSRLYVGKKNGKNQIVYHKES